MSVANLSKENDEEASISGVLVVHVKTVKLFDEEAGVPLSDQLLLKLIVGSQEKTAPLAVRDDVRNTSSCPPLISDSLRHFAINIKVPFDSKGNEEEYSLCVELYMISPLLQTNELLGQAHLSFIGIIQGGVPVSNKMELLNDSKESIATVDLTCVFNYGTFGYGESSQISSEHCRPIDYLKWSTFPRISSQQEEHTTIHCDVGFSSISQLVGTTGMHSTLSKCMKNLPNWQLQYSAIRDRSKRLEYVKRILRTPNSSGGSSNKLDVLTVTGITQRKIT